MCRVAITMFVSLFTSLLLGQRNSLEFKNQILDNGYLDTKTDIKDEFIKHDISPLLTQTKNSRVFGFIGEDYQRFKIKFISIIKNKEKPDQYFVYGKNMVKDNVCEFQGTFTITNVFLFIKTDLPKITQGKIIGEYLLFENPLQKHVGQFKGVFASNWYLDKEGNIKYDDLNDVADGFSNNEFVGTWSSYSGTTVKNCNWGDARIPMSGDLDEGVGGFSPMDKYLSNGLLSYDQAYSGGYEKAAGEKAYMDENREWWK